MTRLIIGCGYLGERVARLWRRAGCRVAAVARSPGRAEQLAAMGLAAQSADVARPETLGGLPEAETVLYCVGYRPESGQSRFDVYVAGLAHVLDALPVEPRRFLLVSSTGVLGEAGGGRVDEETPCRPDREAGRAFLAAEQRLAEHPVGRRSIVLRMAGIYGPGRLPRRADLEAGRPLDVDPDAMLNLIHVDDAAAVVLAAESRARPPRPYLVSDGTPVPRGEFYSRLAGLLGAPAPRFVPREPADAAGASGRGLSNKRVANDRMRAELGVTLRYPGFDDGLRAIVAVEP